MSAADQLAKQLIRDEDKRAKPYLDCCGRYWRECNCQPKGKLTIGIGRNLDDRGLSGAEILALFGADLSLADDELARALPWTDLLDEARRGVFVNMVFNMGIGKFLGFKKMLAAAKDRRWDEAAAELVDSDYGRSATRNRAARLAEQLRSGVWQ